MMKKIMIVTVVLLLLCGNVSAYDIVNPENPHHVIISVIDGKIVNPENPHHELYIIKPVNDDDHPRVIKSIVDPEHSTHELYYVVDNGSYLSIVNPENPNHELYVIHGNSVVDPEHPTHELFVIV